MELSPNEAHGPALVADGGILEAATVNLAPVAEGGLEADSSVPVADVSITKADGSVPVAGVAVIKVDGSVPIPEITVTEADRSVPVIDVAGTEAD